MVGLLVSQTVVRNFGATYVLVPAIIILVLVLVFENLVLVATLQSVSLACDLFY